MWTSEIASFTEVSHERLVKSKLRVQEVSTGLPRGVADAPRGRDSSYFGLFSILESVWLIFNSLRDCLAVFSLRVCFAN